MKRSVLFLFFNVCFSFVFYGQSIELLGRVSSELNIENIHVINKTQQLFTITDQNGLFKILVKLNDTITFSSVQHKPKKIIVTKPIIASKVLSVTIVEQINELKAVVVGKVLTGNLMSDIENIKGKAPVNFFDVGIPGYTGKPTTQSERRLVQAGEFKPVMLLGLLGGSLALDPILNGISGRTKTLKNRVGIEEREVLMRSIKSRLAKDFFKSNPLDNDLEMDFFYFCADDKNFIKHCKNKTDFEILIFLRMKYKQYQENLNSNKD